MGESIIYLDYAAATPLDKRVFSAMEPYLSNAYFNPSASYTGGRQAKTALEDARASVAKVLGAKANDVVFTAGATESVYLALTGLLRSGGHAVIGALEHSAVREAVQPFPHSVATVDGSGLVTVESLERVIRDDTVVISIAMADSEFGVVQPLAEVGHWLEKVREKRKATGNHLPIWLHSDGSQVAGALDLKVSRLGVDMLTLNAAKCYGPKQVGLLWAKSAVKLTPLFAGGGQERGLRSGTENVAGAVGFARALEIAQSSRQNENQRLSQLRQQLVDYLRSRLPDVVVDGNPKRHLAGHLHIHLAGLDAERVVFNLDQHGIAVATGAACAANKATRSPALTAFGLTPAEADGSLRLTFGRQTTARQIDRVGRALVEAIERERAL